MGGSLAAYVEGHRFWGRKECTISDRSKTSFLRTDLAGLQRFCAFQLVRPCMLPLLAGLGPWWTAGLSLVLAALIPATLMPLLGLGRRGSRLRGGAHVLITGGSKGLGLELGRLCAARGCSVTLVARNQKDLDAALLELQAAAAAATTQGKRGSSSSSTPGPKLQALSADTVDPAKVRF